MKADEFITEDDRLDEILPLLVGAARGVGMAARAGIGAAKLGAKAVGAAANAASAVAKGVGSAARAVGSVASAPSKGVGSAARAVGSVASAPSKGVGQQAASKVAGTAKDKALDIAKDQLLKPGSTITLPSATGQADYKVSSLRGNDVELDNPDAQKDPTQPTKLLYKKDNIKKNMAI
jgi:hypothetical protein